MPRVSITIQGKTQAHDLPADKSIYDGLEEKGVQVPHGCLAGVCGSCKIEVLEGAKNLSDPSAVEKDTLNNIQEQIKRQGGPMPTNLRLSCRARPTKGEAHVSPYIYRKEST